MTDAMPPDPTGQQPYPPPPGYPPAPQFGPPPQPQYGVPPMYGQPPYGYRPQPPRKANLSAWIIGIGGATVVVILVCVVFVVFAVRSGANEQNSTRADVKVTNCGSKVALGQKTGDATVAMTNGGTDVAGYSVTVAFTSEDGSQQYGTAVASVDHLEPAQTATAQALGTEPIPGAFVCKIESASRF